MGVVAVSLLASSNHKDTVVVILRTMGKDSRGAMVPTELARVICTGSLHEATQADVERYAGSGVAVYDLKRFVTYDFPGDDISQVEVDGVVYDVVGAPKRYRNSRMTARDVVLLSATKQVRRW